MCAVDLSFCGPSPRGGLLLLSPLLMIAFTGFDRFLWIQCALFQLDWRLSSLAIIMSSAFLSTPAEPDAGPQSGFPVLWHSFEGWRSGLWDVCM